MTAELEKLPCGGRPVRDPASEYAYRCDTCFAVIGSVGMPPACYQAWRDAALSLPAQKEGEQ